MRFDDLDAALAGDLPSLWLITGEEPLHLIEAADRLRAAARARGFDERTVLNASANWDWSQLAQACQSVGLFCARKFVELRLPSPRPGTRGTAALARLPELVHDDVVVAVTLPRDWTVLKAKWYQELARASTVVECPLVTEVQLPQWFTKRIARQKQSLEPDALAMLCARCEGNLLAASQELLKLSYQFPEGAKISAEMIEQAVRDVSRFDAENLMEACLRGDPGKAVRIVHSLQAEGTAIPSFLWMMTDELRMAARMRSLMDSGTSERQALQAAGVWGPTRAPRVAAAARRLRSRRLVNALRLCSDIDRLSKGLSVPSRDSDPWIELASLAAFVAR